MSERELDELDVLMPRTKAANERALVDARNLKQYMEASKARAVATLPLQSASNTIAKRSSVMIRGDVRKDNQGFEDIDEFWADDDDFDPKDDEEDEDETSMSERDLSVNVSMGSMTSERQVRLSGMSTQSNEYDFGGHDDANDGNLSTDTMDLDDEPNDATARPSKKGSKGKSALKSKKSQEPSKSASRTKSALTTPAPAAPKPNSARYSKFSTASSPAPSHDFNMSTSFDTGSAMKFIPIPTRRETQDLGSIKRLIARKSLQSMSPSRVMTQRGGGGGADSGSDSATKSDGKRKRDSFGEGAGFDEVSSPFSLGGDPVSPMSNASERNLDSIKFSDKESGDSPNIRVKLFKGDKFGSARVANDGEKSSKKGKSKATVKSDKSSKKSAAAEKKKAPAAKRAKTKTSYKSTPASDESIDQQTDNDNTFNASTSDDALSDGEESDFDKSKNSKRAKAHELSYARDIFDDSDDEENDASGVRRSKRRRFKPLAWYKGEHYIYERRESGVGLVIPTVAGIERAGTSTPTKTARKYTKRVGAQRKSGLKAFAKSKLPKDLKYEEGEWADLYDTSAGCVNKMNVICRASEIEHRELPSVDGEQPGFAGQSFNLRSSHPFSRWICGRLGLPPGAAKEAESVGDAVQVFYVTNCQPQAVEVSFGPVTDEYFDTAKATRFLLNPGDEFYVPSRNAYYLKNYSEKATCDLHFTIMKPDLPPTVVVSSSEAGAAAGSESPDFGGAKSENVSDRRAAKKQQKRPKP